MHENSFVYFLTAVCVIGLFIGQIGIFIKAREPWWKTLIPIYGNYVLHRIAGCTDVFWGTLGMNIGYALLSGFVAPIVGLSIFTAAIYLVIIIALQISFCNSLAKSFNQDKHFSVGLFFLKPIFVLILGFSNNIEYVNGTANGGMDWHCRCGHLNAAHKLYCDNCNCMKP